MLNWPVVALGWVVNLFQRGTASFGRIAELIEVEESRSEIGRPAFVDAYGGYTFGLTEPLIVTGGSSCACYT